MTASFYVPQIRKIVIIPIFHGISANSFFVPSRCEVFREFSLENISEPVFVDCQENCILISKSIVNSKNYILRILNKTNETKMV